MRLQDLDKFFSQKDKCKHMAFIPYKIFEKILDCLLVFSISYWKSIVFMVKKDHSQVRGDKVDAGEDAKWRRSRLSWSFDRQVCYLIISKTKRNNQWLHTMGIENIKVRMGW